MTQPSPFDAVGRSVTAHARELVGIRRDLHAHPELGRSEVRTTAVVAERLESAGVPVRRLRASGLLADLGARRTRRVIGLRADLDALPIREQTGLGFASRTDGVSHSCGHDVHTTAALGATLALKSIESHLDSLGIGVRVIFQPAEEVMPGGAEDVMSQGGLEGVERIFALHCDPSLDVGQVGLRVGPVTAAASQVEVTLTGRGGHTSRPHLTQDLTFALAKVVTDVPAALSRRMDPRAGAALVWGSVHSGGAHNVIPSTGKASGTLRMLDADAWEGSELLMHELVRSVVEPYGVTADVSIVRGVPPVVNDAASIGALTLAVRGAGAVAVQIPQSLGGEDFAWYLTRIPGAMARLGTRSIGGPTYDLHRGDFVVDEDAIAIGARTLAGAVLGSVVLPQPAPAKTPGGAPSQASSPATVGVPAASSAGGARVPAAAPVPDR